MKFFWAALILTAFYLAASAGVASAARGKAGGHSFHVPAGYVIADETGASPLQECLAKQRFFNGERICLLLPEGAGKGVPAKGEGWPVEYVILLREKRDEPLDRVDFVSLKEYLLEGLEGGGLELQTLVPEGICDTRGRLLLFSDDREALLIREGEESISWLYSAGARGSGNADQKILLFHTVQLSERDLLHVYHVGAAIGQDGVNHFILKAKDFVFPGYLQLRGEVDGAAAGVDHGAGQSTLFFFLALLLVSGAAAVVFWIKRSSI